MKKKEVSQAIAFFTILVVLKSLLLLTAFQNEKSLEQRLRDAILLVEGTPYKWGGESLRGADCSGAIYLIYKLAGKPIPRLTARQMHALYGTGHHYKESKEFDLVWWTFSPRRPYGHIGIMEGDRCHFWHASSKGFKKAGFFKGNYFDRYFESAGRIN